VSNNVIGPMDLSLGRSRTCLAQAKSNCQVRRSKQTSPLILDAAYAHRVAALGHLGEGDECESAFEALLAKRTGFNRRMARGRLFYIKDPEQLDLYIEGLK
jgi:hypothetical protein